MSLDSFANFDALSLTRGHYQLKSDIDALRRVQASDAPEAVAFYAGRILEVLAAQALDDLGLSPHQTVLANLDVLEQYSLMPLNTRYFAHALRRLGNDARHVLRPISVADARVSAFFTECWIDWYLRHYLFGPKLKSRVTEGGEVSTTGPLQQWLVQTHSIDAQQALAFFNQQGLANTPVLPAMLAEALLDRGQLEQAKLAIEQGLATFPGDSKLTLLHGLYLSRSGDLQTALNLLEPLFRRFSNDSEAAGILGGVYKRLWQKEPANSQWLKRSFDTYQAGWKSSRETSAYLGANAATTALWLGRAEFSKSLAGTIRSLLTSRMQNLAVKLPDPLAAMEYWSGATLAELDLLAGDVEGARQIYGKLFALHADKQGSIEVTRRQAIQILRALNSSDQLF